MVIALPEGYLSYIWGSGTTDSTLLITEAQVIAVELEYESGCSLYDSINIGYHNEILVDFEVTPSPDSGPGGNIIVLPSNGTPPYTITWNDAFLSGDTIIGTWPGTYVLTVTDANGCSVVDTVVVPIGSNIVNQQLPTLQIYPNPFTHQLVVESEEVIEAVTVYTLNGQICWQVAVAGTTLIIPTKDWQPGLYLVEVRTPGNNQQVGVEKL